MPSDISLLPDEYRKREEELKTAPKAPKASEPLPMMVPKAEDEEVEVIEVDEGEVGEVLSGEPWLPRTIFHIQSFFDGLRSALFHPRAVEAPPKLPPQFFKPQERSITPPGLVPIGIEKNAAEAAAPTEKPKARIVPSAETPRRVRVIKRVRKPVHVSFVDEAARQLQADLPRRRFTLLLIAVAFIAILAGGYELMNRQGDRATQSLQDAQAQLASLRARMTDRQKDWSSSQDLEVRLKALGAILDQHVMPTRLFDALEKATVQDVHYSSLTLAANGSVTLAASASSYESAAKQIVALRRSGIAKNVDAFGYQATYRTDGSIDQVNFQIALVLNPSVLNAATGLASAL